MLALHPQQRWRRLLRGKGTGPVSIDMTRPRMTIAEHALEFPPKFLHGHRPPLRGTLGMQGLRHTNPPRVVGVVVAAVASVVLATS